MASTFAPSLAVLFVTALFGCEAQDAGPEDQEQSPPQSADELDEGDASEDMEQGEGDLGGDPPEPCDSSCQVGPELVIFHDTQLFEEEPPETKSCPYGGQLEAESYLSQAIERACATWEKNRPHQYSFVYEQTGAWGDTRVLTIDVAGTTVLGAHDSDNRPVHAPGLPTINDIFFDLAKLAELEPDSMELDVNEQTGVPEYAEADLLGFVSEDIIVIEIEYLGGEQD